MDTIKDKLNFDEILLLHKRGKTYKEIADMYNTSASTIGRLMREHNIYGRTKVDEFVMNEIIDLYLAGSSMHLIAKKLHISESTVSTILKTHSIPVKMPEDMNHKYCIDQSYFDAIDTQEKAYFLGFLFADGNVYKTQLSLSLQEKDKYILELLREELKSNHPIILKAYNSKNINWSNQYSYTIKNKHVVSTLHDYGLVPRKSYHLEFPSIIPDQLISHFIRGYFDGNGSIPSNPNEKRVNISAPTDFGMYLKSFCEKTLNIHISVSTPHQNQYVKEFRISGRNQAKRFLDFIYYDATLYLKRKYDLYLKIYYTENSAL